MKVLNTDEATVVQLFTDRILGGQKTYGPLDLATDDRDFIQETLEEALDMAAYLAMRLIQLKQAQARVAAAFQLADLVEDV